MGQGGWGGGASSAGGGGGHAPYLGVTMVISVVGWRMWQVVMVKVDGVWGRLLTERNTGRDRRHWVNREGGHDTGRGRERGSGHMGERKLGCELPPPPESCMHGAHLQQHLDPALAQRRGLRAQVGTGADVSLRPVPSTRPGCSVCMPA